jgi:hypothetical protein
MPPRVCCAAHDPELRQQRLCRWPRTSSGPVAPLAPRLLLCPSAHLLPSGTPPGLADFNLASSGGQLGQASAGLLLGCMEVAMEDLLGQLTGGAGAWRACSQQAARPGRQRLGWCRLQKLLEWARCPPVAAV